MLFVHNVFIKEKKERGESVYMKSWRKKNYQDTSKTMNLIKNIEPFLTSFKMQLTRELSIKKTRNLICTLPKEQWMGISALMKAGYNFLESIQILQIPSKDIEEAFKKGFQKEGIPASIFTFYLNCEAYQSLEEKQRIYTELNTLSLWKPDIIIVNDDQATYSLLACEHPLLDSVPIVFTGVNYPNIPLIQKYPNVSGFWDKPDYRKNVELIERIMGKCVIVRVSDSTALDKKILKDMDEQIKGLCSKARPDYLKYPQYSSPSDKKRSSSLVRFPKVPFDSLYIQTIQPRTSSNLIWGLGTSTYNKAYLATKRDYTSIALGRFCSFPSFSAINESVGYDGDFIGGYMTPVESQTQEALRRAASILKGTPANSFPQITESDQKLSVRLPDFK